MDNVILPGTPPVTLVLRRSARARRIVLRISQLDGRVTLTLPPGATQAEALDFAASKADWIRAHLDGQPDAVTVAPGVVLPVEGRPRRIITAPGRRTVLGDDDLAVPEGQEGRRAQTFLRHLARDRLVAAADRYAAQLGRPYSRITLRDTRSRWGSCSAQGALMFSWRLIMAPPEVLDYVAAHEVAHLAEMNHSPAFWATVENLFGCYKAERGWLRTDGTGLHRYKF